jgi:penicillin-binding protein 1A
VHTKIKWLRLGALLSGLGLLAAVSTVFGMMMAVASDLPEVEVLDLATRSSKIVDRSGKDLGVLTGNSNRILVRSDQIAPVMKHAIVAIEDRRFYTNSGVDLRGVGRALYQDVIAKKAVQGGSTIAQQLVKNRLEANNDRTLFQKLREAAMAFHMTRKWDKERILRNYLNTIYFGNGAYGIESAARTYFATQYGIGTATPLCGSARGQQRCAELLEPAEAALIAGVVASPSGYDPITHPVAAKARRDLVLRRMLEQGYITRPEYDVGIDEPLPTRDTIQPPRETSKYPYFTTWVRQQVVDKVGAGKAFEGGLRVETTIDAELQDAAQAAVDQWIGGGPGRPAAALVALDNDTSEVLAMIGGPAEGYNDRPFNLATQGQRQPGSSFKPFTLAQALNDGISPTSVWSSRKKEFCVTRRKGRCIEAFEVNNYEDNYAGVTTLANATAISDNSVYAELGLKVGTKNIARMARRLGVRTPVSTNPAITLGGLREGVTVMDMAHAYETFANSGKLTYGTLSPGAETFERRDEKGTVPGPVGIRAIKEPGGKYARLESGDKARNKTETTPVLKPAIAGAVESILSGVVRIGSGKRASLGTEIPVSGKTGTTENYGDAWFVGWTPRYTVAVWVGFPDKVLPMEPPTFSFNGDPVAGGTYPAAIWQTFMKSAYTIHPIKKDDDEVEVPTVTGTATPVAPAATTAPEAEAPEPEAPAAEPPAEDEPAPEPQQEAPAPPEETQPAPEGGGTAPPAGGAEPPSE